ncbi:MAG: alpha-amylase family glycosyl hydrolase [Bacteroidetes bacterium]|nr:alpha-amylase family glycosyl hydrolase [Bacteroidota bacterium]
MKPWPKYPVIYEINTWIWLQELSRKYDRHITLSSVPQQEWDFLSSFDVDAVWLMGVWERSPAGLQIAISNEGMMSDFRHALPDLQPQDIVGSPYCVRRYVVGDNLGGKEGLAAARTALQKRGLRLILDFVPNHVAPDHPWTSEHPEYFIRGNPDDLLNDPQSFLKVNGNIFARGRDPYYPAWPDVLQLNVFNAGLQKAVTDTLLEIADQCDGVRCDMAMLVMNSIFEQTWGRRAGEKPDCDYWTELILEVKDTHPEFLFIAEVYWDLEWHLQQQGFDFCYDKRLYDRIIHDDADSIRQHLNGDITYQSKLIRFIENHDEPRAAFTLSPMKARTAAVALLTLPGAKLLHEGQFEGRKEKVPVFLTRRPEEPADRELEAFYKTLLNAVNNDTFRNGRWQLCESREWHKSNSNLNILAWCWQSDEERYVIILNFSNNEAQAYVRIPFEELQGKMWIFYDVLSGEIFEKSGDEMTESGVYVSLNPWEYSFFRIQISR